MVISRLTLLAFGAHVAQPRSQRRSRHAPPLAYWNPHDIGLWFLRQRTVPTASQYRHEGALNGISQRAL